MEIKETTAQYEVDREALGTLFGGYYDRGLEKGLKKGREEGLETGIKKGFETGIKKGFETGIQKGIETGIQRGIETGILKGGLQSRMEIARKMFEKGFSESEIMEITALSSGEFRSIKS